MSDIPEITAGRRWAAAGAVSANEIYIGGRLTYLRAGEVETQFINKIGGKQAIRLLIQPLVIAVVVGFLFTVLILQPRYWDDSIQSIWAVNAFIVFMVMLLIPDYEPLSEWQLLLDGKAKVAESAYAVIFRVLRHERDIPAEIRARRKVTGLPVRGVRNFLFMRLGKYRMQVSVFPFGADLYFGWTLWRRQVPISVIFRGVTSLGRINPEFSDLIDVEPVKALRESVHNALRQGIEAAAAELDVSLLTTFGYEIPIEGSQSEISIDSRSRMSVPVPPPAPSTTAQHPTAE